MRVKVIYLCEKCGMEFEELEDCEKHEGICNDKHAMYRKNVELAIQLIKEKYGSFITSAACKIDEEIEDFYSYGDCDLDLYKFKIAIKLANGNTLIIYDGFDGDLRLGNYLETPTLVKTLIREIDNRLSTSYEGVIRWDYGEDDSWREDYIGDIKIYDIVDRLYGRKVKIEVIE